MEDPEHIRLTPLFVRAAWEHGWLRAIGSQLELLLDEYESCRVPASQLIHFADLLDELANHSSTNERVLVEASHVTAYLRQLASNGADAWITL